MSERKYEVLDHLNRVIAGDMTLEMAWLFIKAYCQKYYTELITITLREVEAMNELHENRSDAELQTNADKIRNMSDEELAEFLRQTVWEEGANLFECAEYSCGYPCEVCKEYLKWLQSEAK